MYATRLHIALHPTLKVLHDGASKVILLVQRSASTHIEHWRFRIGILLYSLSIAFVTVVVGQDRLIGGETSPHNDFENAISMRK